MSVMELAEVVNPHFAVPVVGVVLCAVLVFAFGFKSSVQPPSFDFENKQRSRPKQSKKSKKPQSNGHVVTVETGVAPGLKPASPKPASSPKSSATEKSETVQKAKAKKTATTPKSAKLESVPVVKKAKEEQDAGEWVTAKTRKRKPKKDEAKKDDGSDSSPEANKIESTPEPEAKIEVAAPPEVKPESVTPVQEAPLEKRSSKKERRKKDSAEKPVPVSVQEPIATTSTEAESEKKETAEHDSKAVLVEEVAIVDDEKMKPSPKKTKKKKGKSVAAEVLPVKEVVAPVIDVVDVKAEEKDPIQAALEDAAADDDTLPVGITGAEKPATPDFQEDPLELKNTTRSPKKKKKSKDSREKYPETTAQAPEVESTSEAVKGDVDMVSAAEHCIDSVNEGATSRVSSAEVSSDAPTSDSPSIEGAKSTKTDQSPVTFDELGEWQEAKPVKRKKKARRDN